MATGGRSGNGPVPVRDLMRRLAAERAEAASVQPAPTSAGEMGEHRFRMEDRDWVARVAGTASYGTGRTGLGKLVAVHFFADDEPGRPEREALLPAGEFAGLAAEELRALFDRATPIELER